MDNKTASRNDKRPGALRTLGLALLCCGAVVAAVAPCVGRAQTALPAKDEQAGVSGVLEKFLVQDRETTFVYQREGRPDPFFPFLTQQILQAETAARKELTGMRRFEPGQLVLVAVVFTEKEPLAMVQDSAGMGYVLRKGTRIGRAGEVVDIVPNKVVIKEQTYSLVQGKQYRTVEMVLTTEGDKKK